MQFSIGTLIGRKAYNIWHSQVNLPFRYTRASLKELKQAAQNSLNFISSTAFMWLVE
jgi:hypothetical protein